MLDCDSVASRVVKPLLRVVSVVVVLVVVVIVFVVVVVEVVAVAVDVVVVQFCFCVADEEEPKSDLYDHPQRELFLWAILFNREKLSLRFWKAGRDHIGMYNCNCIFC